MRKILEIDALKVLEQSNLMFSRHYQPREQWIEAALSAPQLEFLRDKKYVFRSHPKHSPTVELFVDENTVDHSEWSMLHLLFSRRNIA
jgi:hypothetical protein